MAFKDEAQKEAVYNGINSAGPMKSENGFTFEHVDRKTAIERLKNMGLTEEQIQNFGRQVHETVEWMQSLNERDVPDVTMTRNREKRDEKVILESKREKRRKKRENVDK